MMDRARGLTMGDADITGMQVLQSGDVDEMKAMLLAVLLARLSECIAYVEWQGVGGWHGRSIFETRI